MDLLRALLLCVAIGVAVALGAPSTGPPPLRAHPAAAAAGPGAASVTVDLASTAPISPLLFGAFFEEIGHAGDGGLYAELIQDRSFDATAAAARFSSESDVSTVSVDLSHLGRDPMQPVDYHAFNASGPGARHHRERLRRSPSSNDIIVPWAPLAGTRTALTRQLPLHPGNTVAMELSSAADGVGGIINVGFWGVAIKKGNSYAFSVFMRTPEAFDVPIEIALTSADLKKTPARLALTARGAAWRRYAGTLTSSADDPNARLVLSFKGPATIIVDSFSLFPSENAERGVSEGLPPGTPWPFRADLLDALRALRPAFLRFPGGCFVEGDRMANAFRWKTALGGTHTRPGHWNLWGYWSTDGLGLFEYMLLIEELQTEPIWVINNGVAHADSVAPAAVWSLVQDALDSLEFISGDEHTPWGAVRAAMGRPKPLPPLRYIAIGNEDCGKPWYLENYLLFAGALKAAAPELQLISNCDLGPAAPADLFDWHMYTSPQSMFDLRTVFDDRKPDASGQPKVFASEYAVTDGGGHGNLAAAVAEAAFMTEMERNGGVVAAAAYAPLFVRTQDRPWPTDLIVFDGESWFGIPSYYVQRMFRETQGVAYAATATGGAPGAAAALAASTTCQDPSCSDVVLKVVNFGAEGVNVSVSVRRGGKGAGVQAGAAAMVLTGAAPEEENSFEDPMKVAPVEVDLDEVGDEFALELAPWSVNLVRLKVGASPRLGGGSGGGDVAAVA